MSVKAAAYQVMEAAYLKASSNGTLPANARQIMYVARPLIIELTGKASPWKNDATFTQMLLPDFMRDHLRSVKTGMSFLMIEVTLPSRTTGKR
ncbi:MAG: hypothetical protein HC889_16275, partial [Synechococcaceae cyanobacterium SM1_2_3]|nr:hypothetical protein [Synechococcaceae cyanobacterium SM1_2_3]